VSGVARLALLLVTTVLPLLAQAKAQENGTPATPPAMPAPTTTNAAGGRTRASSVMQRHITIDLRRVRLADALLAVAQGGGVGLVHGDDVASDSALVTVHLVDVELGKAFESVLQGTGFVAREKSGVVVIMRDSRPRADAESDSIWGGVFGQVTDSATRKPLGGVEVTIRGLRARATTNDSGYYIIRTPIGAYIAVARLLGYDPVERNFLVREDPQTNNGTRLDLLMRVHAEKMQEVIVTASGPQRRLELPNDIVTINVDSVMQAAPIHNVTDLLEGRVPGLDVQHTSGVPGDPSRLRLRGIGSITRDNAPIVIVDGIRLDVSESRTRNSAVRSGIGSYNAPSRLDQIDPNSIATIEIFKGPSASSLYGSDAANGVIVITTKKGRAGPPQWQISSTQGISELPGSYPNTLYRWGHSVAGGGPILCPRTNYGCIQDSLVSFQALNDPQLRPFALGHRSDASISVSGGSQSLTYSLTGSGSQDIGLFRLPDTDLQRYQLFQGTAAPSWMKRPDQLTTWAGSSQLTTSIGSSATVSLQSSLTSQEQQRSSIESAIGALEGEFVDRSQLGVQPLIPGAFERARSKSLNFTNAANLSWNPWTWLPVTATAGVSVDNRDDQTLLPHGLSEGADSAGHFSVGSQHIVSETVDLGTNIVSKLPFGMRLTTGVGMNLYRTSGTIQIAQTFFVPVGVETPQTLGDGSEVTSHTTTIGWRLSPTLAITPRLLISPGFRIDGGSTSGRHATFSGFPKMGASWLLSDERFFPFKKTFNTLRLRVAYGHAGVQPGLTDRLRLYAAGGQTRVTGDTVLDGLILTSLGNTQLRPERATDLEGGFDADMFDSRITITYSGYSKLVKDEIVSIPVAPSVHGGGTQVVNIGEVSDRGAEVGLGFEPLRSPALTWRVNVTFSTNANKLVRLAAGQVPIDLGDGRRIVPNYPLFGQWAKPVVGWVDRNTDRIIDSTEVLLGDSATFLGQPQPKYNASLATTVGLFHGRVTLNAGFTYQDGATQFNQGAAQALLQAANDPNASLATQAAVAAANVTPYGLIQTVNTLRFNSFSLSVAMPSRFAAAFRARTMSLALLGSNLALHTNYHGIDPNVNAFVGDGNIDTGVLPQPRTFSLSIRLSN
jgi:TonB-dependent SusC/RagA subfamily outer membrane receptor